MVKYWIVLTGVECEQLQNMLSKGKHAARKLT